MKSLALFSLVNGASAILAPRSDTKCPLHGSEGENRITGKYNVRFHDDHSLEDHLSNIGINITDLAIEFNMWPENHAALFGQAYEIHLPEEHEYIIHDLVRNDPGVRVVHQDEWIFMDTDAEEAEQHEIDPRDVNSTLGIGVVDSPSTDDDLQKRANYETETRRGALWNHAMISKPEKQSFHDEYDDYGEYKIVKEPAKGVHVYVFDNGVFTRHVQFDGRASHMNSMYDQDISPYCSTPSDNGPKSGDQSDVTMEPKHGHGTHVAGIIAAKYAGYTRANIVNVRVMCSSGSTTLKMVKAVRDVIAEHQFYKEDPPPGWRGSVINVSMGWTVHDPEAVREVFQDALNNGIPIAAAAGNTGENYISLPGSLKTVMSVGAVNKDYDRWYKSNHNKKLDIFAPGQVVGSTWTPWDSPDDHDRNKDNTNAIKWFSGTSMASPHVAAVMAIMMGYEGHEKLTPGYKVYDRIKENMADFVNKDAAMKERRTTRALLQSGMEQDGNQPYSGIPKDELKIRAAQEDGEPNNGEESENNEDNGGGEQPGDTINEDENMPDPADKENIPEVPDEEFSLEAGDNPEDKPSEFNCFDMGGKHYVEFDRMSDIIQAEFCPDAEDQGKGDEGRDDGDGNVIERLYNEGTADEVRVQLKWPGDMDFTPSQYECTRMLQTIILGGCDRDIENPHNYRSGGWAATDDGKVEYRIEPQKDRRDAKDDLMAGCKISVGEFGPRKSVTTVNIWGGGWESWGSAVLLEELVSCGVDSTPSSVQTEYKLGDDGREWTVTLAGSSNEGETTDSKCITEAMKRAGAPDIESCES